jgi:hypothetical protein
LARISQEKTHTHTHKKTLWKKLNFLKENAQIPRGGRTRVTENRTQRWILSSDLAASEVVQAHEREREREREGTTEQGIQRGRRGRKKREKREGSEVEDKGVDEGVVSAVLLQFESLQSFLFPVSEKNWYGCFRPCLVSIKAKISRHSITFVYLWYNYYLTID